MRDSNYKNDDNWYIFVVHGCHTFLVPISIIIILVYSRESLGNLVSCISECFMLHTMYIYAFASLLQNAIAHSVGH